MIAVSARAGTVYKTAQAAGLDTFVAAVDAAGLKKRLDNTNYKGTVFPPTGTLAVALLSHCSATRATAASYHRHQRRQRQRQRAEPAPPPAADDAFDKWAQKTGMKLEALLGNKALLTTL